MSSTSAAGVSIVTLQFTLGETLDVAEQEVQAAINAGGSLLPADLPAPPVYAKVNPADAPVLTLAVTSDTLPLTEVQNLVNTRLAQKISQVSGVGLVSLSGGQRPAVRIQADTQALASYGLGLDTVRTAISSANANSAKGSFDGATRAYTINANDQLLAARDYASLIVAYRNGAPVRLTDVARIVDAAENVKLGAWAGEGGVLKPAIVINVQRQPGANVIATVDAIKARLPELQAGLPASVNVQLLTDRTTGIRASVRHVEYELLLAVALVVLVIFAFLHDLRATVIASLSVPISLIGSCGAMYLLGYSLNNLSLMALTIATGFVVDDAIVMIENIARYIEEGETAMAAAIKGATQIGFTIISLTVSLIAVLIPLLFMGDIVGRLFREFAVTLAITILISAVVSLTLVPMMSGRWLHASRDAEKPGSFSARIQRGFDHVVHAYDRALQVVAEPSADHAADRTRHAGVDGRAVPVDPEGACSRRRTPGSCRRASRPRSRCRTRALVEAAACRRRCGAGRPGGGEPQLLRRRGCGQQHDAAHGPAADQPEGGTRAARRKTSSSACAATCSRVAGVTIYLQPTQDLTIDAESGPTEYRFSLEGADNATVNQWAAAMVQQLQNVPQVRNVVSDAAATAQAAYIDIDRDTASRLGISASSVDDALYSAFGQRIVSTIFTETNQYRVILEARPDLLQTPASLGLLHVKTSSGGITPLSAIARISEKPAPLQVTHVAQYPATTLGFDTRPASR